MMTPNIITRAEAIKQELKHYFTGMLCKNGHISVRSVIDCGCLQCAKEREQRRRLNPDIRKRQCEYVKHYYKNNTQRVLERDRLYRKQNKDYVYSLIRKRYQDDPQKRIWQRAKVSARQRGLDFNIDIEDIALPSHCPIFGIELDYSFTGRAKENTATLDRVDNTKGYVKGNVSVISKKANETKRDLTIDTLQKLHTYIMNFTTA